MEQKYNSVSSAGTNDDSITKADVTTSSPNNAKPNVSGSFCHTKIKRIKQKLIKSIEKETNKKGCFWADSDKMLKIIDKVFGVS